MLYNKNNVRKTNDKKILHKVGKQWKVVSIALLMAIGGGAAVAATNTANANADANNGLTADDQAQINSLEAGPQEGQSSAPASQSSQASSASDKAPVAPNFSGLRPDSMYNGNNASAEKHWVLQGYDKAVVKYYGNKVNSYVSQVNAKLPSAASSVNSNYDKAASTQNTDKSLAASYSAVAATKDWSAEVSNIAMNKSGIDAQDYIANVSASASNYSGAVKTASENVSGASSVASLASLIYDINQNQGVSDEYALSAYSAYLTSSLASVEFTNASSALSGYIEDSKVADSNALTARNNSQLNDLNNKAANYASTANAGLMSSWANDEASKTASNSVTPSAFSSAFSNVRNQVSLTASYANVYMNNLHNIVNNTYSTSVNDSLVNELPEALKARFNNLNGYVQSLVNASEAANNYTNALSAAQSNASYINSSAANSAAASVANSVVNSYNHTNNKNASAINSVNSANISSANAEIAFNNNTTESNLNNLSNTAKEASKAANDYYSTNFAQNSDDAYRLVSAVAEQQVYGANRSAYNSTIASASAAARSLGAEISSAQSNYNSLKVNSASASANYQVLSALGDHPTLSSIPSMLKSGNSDNAFAASEAQYLTTDINSSAESSNVSAITSDANKAGSGYNSAVSASNSYNSSADTNFVLAQVYAGYYNNLSGSDQTAYNSASAAKDTFYSNYAGSDFGHDEDMVNTYQPAIKRDGAFANAYAVNVQINEPHVVTVTKKAVLHSNPDYNVKSDKKLGIVPVGTHLKVENVGFDREGDTRLYVNYNGQHGFITGLRTYVKNSYLTYGNHYKVTFKNNVNVYKSLQFNKGTYVTTLKAGTPVTGTAVRNDPGYYNGLTRLQLDNPAKGNTTVFVTTLDSTIQSVEQLTGQNNSVAAPKGAFFYNGQDHTPASFNA